MKNLQRPHKLPPVFLGLAALVAGCATAPEPTAGRAPVETRSAPVLAPMSAW